MKMYASESAGERFPMPYPGYYPADGSAPVESHTFFWGPVVYPEYLSDIRVIFCPSDPDGQNKIASIQRLIDSGYPEVAEQLRDYSYQYIGWVSLEDVDWITFKSTTRQARNADKILPGWFVTSDMQHSADTLASVAQSTGIIPRKTQYLLREGIERFLITDINAPGGSALAQSRIPVMWDIVSTGYKISGTSSGNQFNHIPGGMNVLYMDGHVDFLRYPNVFPCSPFMAEKLGRGGPTNPTEM